MKKDIEIPEVKDVYIAIVKEEIPDTNTSEWNVYIINDKDDDLDLIFIVCHGFSKAKQTSTLRKTINHLPKKSSAKIEMIQESLFKFTNEFKVSFFKENQLYDKTFTFKPNSIKDEYLIKIPLLQHKGILSK